MTNQIEINIQDESNEERENLLTSVDTVKNEIVKEYKKHLYWIDALRILASYMVILVHSSFYTLYDAKFLSDGWVSSRFWDSISRPCVPLFIMISGALFLDPEKNISISKMYKKYIYRIVKVLLFWNIVYVTVGKFIINGINVKYTWNKELIFKIYEETLMGKYHLWYLYMCIGLYIITPFARAICKEKKLMNYYISASLILSQAIPNVFTLIKLFWENRYIETIGKLVGKLQMNIIGGYACHFVLGYYLTTHEFRNKTKLIFIWITGILCELFTYSMKIILSKKNQKEIGEFDGYTKINVTVASIAIFLFFKYPFNKLLTIVIRNNYFKTTLLKLSSLTFGIYQIHVCFLELFLNLNIKYYKRNILLLVPVHALLIWILSAGTILLMKKIPFVKEFL
ncbi:hypothetical protein PIROE2DRAFT_64453 [Piromyces sp. E2]|nr:hypothetical protein PIROE2DRAFT_64453 [Piromyces sp. E2]|eukprot:OUM58365.1 hypothetical protein PIROE2DRAFT_64453 [Piromyces sp. E2]